MRTCRRRKGSRLAVWMVIFALIIPTILGIAALVEHMTIEVPEETTADFIAHAHGRYLSVVTEKTEAFKELNRSTAETALFYPSDSLSAEAIAQIMGLDPDKTEVTKKGAFKSTLESGETLSVFNGTVTVNGATCFRIFPNGQVRDIWAGYNSSHETTIVIGNQTRTTEEMAAIAMIADSVEKADGNYKNVNKEGSRTGVLCDIFFGYLAFEVAAIILVLILLCLFD